ncbi:MAG TPA: sensor histidine kinase KdpD [Polyangiaceae bacterium]|jgi:two-component system sensor histidine kinase KdpD|nr:sensor histidine kinase KdpD [Polyangiaceae bacterium]
MTAPDIRPDPDALLARIHSETTRAERAKLRIYLGYAPGVGKTFSMLSAARELRESGKDVVIGLVETHARYDTAALVLGLEMLPRRKIDYKGRTLEEFDLDAALARKPRVLLLDELAHTNAPGARHAKRWQDVLDLLDAGIDIHTTVNIQHVESLNDVVAQITTVRVRETVPDSILARADEVELVDLPPDELLARLRDGKVYLTEQASRAVDNFFRRGNLLALRELALRRAADRVDLDILAHREANAISTTWPTQERILVCVGPSPASARLIRAAARMAVRLHAPFVAAYVEAVTGPSMSDEDRERLEAHLRLAESLGGDVARLSGATIARALVAHARRENFTRIVIGKPTHSRLRDLVRGSLLDEVVRGSGEIDVHVISGEGVVAPPPRTADGKSGARIDVLAYAAAAGLVTAATSVSVLGRNVFALPDEAMLYLMTIMVVAARLGRGPSVLAAALSVASYDFFFIPPFYTFAVSDARHTLTFSMMFGVGLVISGFTLRIRRQEQEARSREEQTSALYGLSRELGNAVASDEVAEVIASRTAKTFECSAAVIVAGAEGALKVAAESGEVPWSPQEQAVARWVLEHARPAGLSTDTLPGARVTCLPMSSGPVVLGVLALTQRPAKRGFAEYRSFNDAFVRQCAMALERARLAEEGRAAALRARTEEMRSSLLSAVSHDLRTPLAAITGAGTMLRDESVKPTPAQEAELLATIVEEAERLERLVTNLLDMTRIESGAVKVKREWVPLEELVVSALARLEPKLDHRQITTELPDDLPLISVDPVLFEQVFLNLFENASKYTPPGSPLEIRARAQGSEIVVEVADRGPGLRVGEEAHIFEKFVRGARASGGGVGLGLAICRGIVESHGGTLSAENREGGGALFRITLPILGDAPDTSAEPELPRSAEARP